ncbi:hypothetical protein SCODD09_01389 [Streptococcus constellatus]|nr:hypothetical protein SCODD09_01389 [Streptococcus constellatus]
MTKEEVLQYLQEKRRLTAPVAVTLNNLREKKKNCQKLINS